MKQKLLGLSTLCAMAMLFVGCFEAQSSDPYDLAGKTHKAVTPTDRLDVEWWAQRHQEILERVAQGNVDLIFVGDSITHYWDRSGKEIWQQYYAPRNAVNMGYGSDGTQHVLWRLENGEIDGIDPKLAVLLIGINNSYWSEYTAEQVADGIKAVCAKIRTKLPKTKILMLAIFPYGEDKQCEKVKYDVVSNALHAKNHKVSQLASQIAGGKHIFYLDINKAFLDENGLLTRDIMPDLVHPNEKGYKIWAEAMEPTIKKLMDEK
jgi:beta-glucosidase